jgi:hypothetical protein
MRTSTSAAVQQIIPILLSKNQNPHHGWLVRVRFLDGVWVLPKLKIKEKTDDRVSKR